MVFKSGYFFVNGGKIPLYSLNKIGEESQATICSSQICEQAVVKLPLAYSFQKTLLIDQNSEHIYMTITFDFLLIISGGNMVCSYKLQRKPIIK